MGSWEELCLLCGVFCGPSHLVSKYGVDDVAKAMATEVHPADEETLAIVKDALLSSFSDKDRMPGHIPTWLPDGMGNAGYSTGHYVAVGCFDENGEASLRDGKVPEGRHAEVRRVRDGDGGDFGEILTTHEDGEEAWESAYTACSVRSEGGVPNVFFCERCYAYLEKWQSLPASASEGAQAPSAAELYEIVNSRKARRDEITGLLPDIDYDGIEASLNQWQSHFIACRRGSKHLAHAINTGLRGADLIPAILQDCRAWMFMRPDVWPESPKAMQIPTFAEYPLARGSTMPRIGNLPNELLLLILHDLPLPSLLALSATCRSLRALITAPAFLDQVLKEAMTQGSLRWLLPVEGLLDEHERACAALQTWMPEEHRPTPAPSSLAPSNDVEARAANAAEPPIKPLVMSPHFQRLAFVRACWQSDSMMNRKRLWGQVKQFEGLWEDYRLHGWQVDRFYA